MYINIRNKSIPALRTLHMRAFFPLTATDISSVRLEKKRRLAPRADLQDGVEVSSYYIQYSSILTYKTRVDTNFEFSGNR